MALLFSGSTAAGEAEPPFERGLGLIRNELLLARTGWRALQAVAHPGAEDGAALSYLRRTLGVETHVCFLTRGEGEPNEAGPEWGAKLAVLRTRETEAACAILGAKAWYLNLPDFGRSKSAEEALRVWGHERALAQLVRVIRIVRPQLVFTGHDPDGKDDGQQAAAARLLLEAFDAATDPQRFPEQAQELHGKPWTVSKLYVRRPTADGATVSCELTARDAVSGLNATEVAGYALAKHVSQRLRAEVTPGGEEMRHFALVKSRLPKTESEKGMTDGLKPVADIVRRSEEVLQKLTPAAMDDGSLARSMQRAFGLDIGGGARPGETEALAHANLAMAEVAGVKLEVRVDRPVITYDEEATITLRVSNRGPVSSESAHVQMVPETRMWDTTEAGADVALTPNEATEFRCSLKARPGAFQNYPAEEFIFSRLEERPLVAAQVRLAGCATLHKRVPLDLAPPRTVTVSPDPVLVFDDPDHGDDVLELTRFRLHVTNHRQLTEPLKLYAGIVPQGGAPVDRVATLVFHRAGETQGAEFRFMAPIGQLNKGDIEVPTAVWTERVNFGGPKARLRRVPLRLPLALHVGLVKGLGDETLNALQALANAGLGMTLSVLSADDLRAADLNRLHTIVLDTQAAAKRPELRDVMERLMQFMQDGGNVVCMSQGEGKLECLPYAIEPSSERVTDESAAVRLLEPRHPLLLAPCKIWGPDFQGWMEERGAYIPRKWAANYTALLSCNDTGEKPLDGGLLVTDVGAGSFIYTSLAWHIQLRAGVPGAYRMLANMIGYHHTKRGAKP